MENTKEVNSYLQLLLREREQIDKILWQILTAKIEPDLDDIGKGMLQAYDLKYRIEDYGRRIRELDAKAERNVLVFVKRIAACVNVETTDDKTASEEHLDEETIDGEIIDEQAFRKCMWEYLENDLQYKAELSLLEAEKDKIDAEMVEMNGASSPT